MTNTNTHTQTSIPKTGPGPYEKRSIDLKGADLAGVELKEPSLSSVQEQDYHAFDQSQTTPRVGPS